MKRIFCFVFALTILFTMNLGTVAHAASMEKSEVSNSATRAITSSKTADLEFSKSHIGRAVLTDVGALPTIKVTIGGNPNLLYRVIVISSSNDGGNVIAENVPADGRTISAKIWAFTSATYNIEVLPCGGSSAEQTYWGTVEAEW